MAIDGAAASRSHSDLGSFSFQDLKSPEEGSVQGQDKDAMDTIVHKGVNLRTLYNTGLQLEHQVKTLGKSLRDKEVSEKDIAWAKKVRKEWNYTTNQAAKAAQAAEKYRKIFWVFFACGLITSASLAAWLACTIRKKREIEDTCRDYDRKSTSKPSP